MHELCQPHQIDCFMVYFQDAYTWLVNDMIYKSLFWPDDFDLDETAFVAEKLLDESTIRKTEICSVLLEVGPKVERGILEEDRYNRTVKLGLLTVKEYLVACIS